MQLFVTKDRLVSLITKSEIEGALQRQVVDATAKVVRFAGSRGVKVFTTLVYSQLTHKFRDFIKYGFHDSSLPVEYDICTGVVKGARMPREHADIFRSWKPVEFANFAITNGASIMLSMVCWIQG